VAWLKRHWHWLFLLLIPILPLWRAVFLGEAIGPFDQIRQFAPWNGPAPKDAWDVLQADGVLQFYVWRDLVFESWRNFQVPFWNPYQLMGTPLLANSQSGALYPPHILMGILHVPTPLAITLLAWFHLFWAGLGVSKLVRALGGSEVGGVVAGASFALSPFMLSWTALSSVITTVAWIPWALYFACIACHLRRVRVRPGFAISLCLAMSLLGGHLQFAAYGFFAVAVFSLVFAFHFRQIVQPLPKEEIGRYPWIAFPVAYLLAPMAAIVLGGLIALPQLLPVLKHSADSHRRNVPSEAGYQAYVASAIKPFEFANLVTPKALGDPRTPVDVGNGMTVAEYWPPLAKQGANFAEAAVTIGPLVLGLLFLVPWRDRRTWPIAAIGVLSLLLAMGTILNKALYFGLPGWSSTGSPGRIIVLFVLAACVLAGLGVRPITTRRYLLSALLAFLVPTSFMVLFPLLAPTAQPGMQPLLNGISSLSSFLLEPFVLVGVGVGVLFVLNNKFQNRYVYWLSVVPLILAAYLSLTLIPTGKPLDNLLTTRPAEQIPVDRFNRIAFVNEDWGIIAAAKSPVIPPNLAALFRVHDPAGYDSLLNKDTKAILDEANGGDSAPPANGNIMFVKPTADPNRLAELGVRELWSRRPIEAFGEPLTQENGYLRYRVPGPGRLSIEGGQSKVLSEVTNAVRVQAQGPGRLILRDRNLPGWKAIVDGEPAELKGTRWLEVDLAGGDHIIDFTYSAPGFSTGMLLGIPALLLALAGLLWGNRSNRNDPPSQEPEVQ
jgi:hypothetical protein